jgi:Zn-finger nucleic acid-binding protein
MQMTCPKCHGEMRVYERSGVTVDQCTECRGIFLDRGELEKLFEAESTFNSRPAAPGPPPGAPVPPVPPPGAYSPPPPPPPGGGYPPPAYGQPAYGQPAYGQPGYGQPAYGQTAAYGHHGHYRQQHHGHYRNRKQKSFLKDLFD